MTRSMTGVAGCLLAVALAVGCSSYPKDAPGQVRTECERYVKERLRKPSAQFSGEQVEIGSVRTRASVKGYVSAGSSPQWFLCSVEERHGGWNLVVLAGL